jgi:nitroreductase
MNSIFKRRSIRQYTDEFVSDEHVNKILEAAMSAPSARNARPWHFIVARDKSTLEKLSNTHANASMIKNANAAIVVCGDLSKQSHKDYWVLDCSAATENILIEVEELGLGAVWVAVYPREERINHVIKVFNLPNNIIPLCIVPIGYPAETPEPKIRYDESKVHCEKW